MARPLPFVLLLLGFATFVGAADYKVNFYTWNTEYAPQTRLDATTAVVLPRLAGVDVSFFCEQEANARMGGPHKWGKSILTPAFEQYSSSLSSKIGGRALFGAGGITRSTATQMSVVAAKGVTVAKTSSWSKTPLSSNGKGWVGGKFTIKKTGKPLLTVGALCAHLPTEVSKQGPYLNAFKKVMNKHASTVDLWLFGGDLNNRLDTEPATAKKSTSKVPTPDTILKIATDKAVCKKLSTFNTQKVDGTDFVDTTKRLSTEFPGMNWGSMDTFTYKYDGATGNYLKPDEDAKNAPRAKVKHVGFQGGFLDRVGVQERKAGWTVAAETTAVLTAITGSDHQCVERSVSVQAKSVNRFMTHKSHLRHN